MYDNPLVTLAALVLLPLIPAFVLFRVLRSQGKVDGTMGSFKIALGGAFGGYFALTVFIATFYAQTLSKAGIEEWTVTGSFEFDGAAAMLLFLVSAVQAATVRGKVSYAGGKPCAGAVVTVVNSAKQSSTEAYTDAQGMYYLPNVPAGRYTLNVRTNRATKLVPITVAAGEYSNAPAVTVN